VSIPVGDWRQAEGWEVDTLPRQIPEEFLLVLGGLLV
jgi:hypothetical protein